MSKAVANLTQLNETITFSAQDNGETINVKINELARGPAGADGPNSVTSATTSDGTANLSLSNVTTATATVTGTLTADHIHGNLAGSVYAHVRAGENLAKGDPVYISGSHGSGSTLIAIVSKADASDPLKMPAVGVMDAAVTANANGHMVITGTISDIDTATYSVNAELYVAEGGGFTATPPNAYAQPVARVERSNTNNGAVIVKVNGLSAISPTASTLVRRDSSGVSDFNTINLGDLHTGGSPSAPYGSIGKSVLTGSSGVGISGNPDVALEAATHRLTLSSSGIALTSGTITTSQPLSLTQTWNAAGVTFKGIDVNITDTSSASGSLLMDLRVGGGTPVSKFSVKKNGVLTLNNSGTITWTSADDLTFSSGLAYQRVRSYSFWASNLFAGIGDNGTAASAAVHLANSQFVGWTSGAVINLGTYDTFIGRDNAANTLAQRNGTNAQESRVYGTYTSATNFERLNLKYNGTATAFQIGTEKGSAGGTARPLEFQTDGTTRMTIGSTGSVTVPGGCNFGTTTISSFGPVLTGVGNVGKIRGQNGGGLIFGSSSGTSSDNVTAIYQQSSSVIDWAGDVGIVRTQTGVIKVTNGSTGDGTISAIHRLQGTAPASATAAGTAGDIRYDADYIYICTATNTWKRAAIATWP